MSLAPISFPRLLTEFVLMRFNAEVVAGEAGVNEGGGRRMTVGVDDSVWVLST